MNSHRWLSWALLLSTAVFILIIFTDALPWLRGPQPDSSVWYWPYQVRPYTRWWLLLLAGGFFLVVWGWWLRQQNSQRWQTAVALTLLFASGIALQWGMLYADRSQPMAELVDRTLAVQTNGYFWTAANITDMTTTLQTYPTAMTQFESDHARTHPPGLVVINWLSLRLMSAFPALAQPLANTIYPLRCTDLWLLEQPAATAAGLGLWAVLPLLLAAATILPAYGLGRTITQNENAAKTAMLVITIPALLLFAPLPDQFFALLTLLIVWAYVWGWQQQKTAWLLAAGFLLSLTTFFSVGNLALLAILGSYTLLSLGQQPLPLKKLIISGGTFAAGLALVWLIYWLGWGVAPWAVIQAGLDEHYALVTTKRSYTTWLLFNLLDLIIFTGFPAVAGFLAAIILATRRLGVKTSSTSGMIALSTAVLILLLNLSGSTRGEVGRIWLFFMPLMVLSGGVWLANQTIDWRVPWGWGALQLAWAIALGLSWRPMGATIVVAQQPDYPPLPTDGRLINVDFGEQLTLQSAALQQTTDALNLTLVWATEGPTIRPYTVFNHLIDAEGNLVAQADGWSVNGQWPPTCWQPNEQIVDPYQVVLPPTLPPGSYTLLTGLYDARDGTRLLTTTGVDHAVTGQITLPAE